MVRVNDNGNEQPVNRIREFKDVRQFGAAESTQRIFEFEMGTRYPAVVRLPIQLKIEQHMYVQEYASLREGTERRNIIELTGFLNFNACNLSTKVSYINFPEKFIYEDQKWQLRKKGTHTIGRMYTVHPNKGEVFYLRMLLADTATNFSAGKNRSRN